ncbi:MAG: N-acetylneuraminate synthase [Rhodospirillaceae bacterium]|nr:MAG: N-acetylneuraminate synthase [Rhodospirillaceae bacterium]
MLLSPHTLPENTLVLSVSRHTFIIAEAGVNHNGSREQALALVDAAARAGADAVKFQTFRSELLTTARAPKAAYQARNTGEGGNQLAMLKALELSVADHEALVVACRARGIEFMSTPFEPESARFLVETLNVARLKVASGEITNGPLLLQLARSHKPIVLSTGMATLQEVREALGVIAFGYVAPPDAAPNPKAFRDALKSPSGKAALGDKVTVLHCTSEYPAPPESINLHAMTTLAKTFGLPVGLSDHSEGIAVSVAAVGLGAVMIEKHFTLDKALPGPDHKASLTPAELTALVAAVRVAEQALGDPKKQPTASELSTRRVARKSLVAMKAITAGEPFTSENLGIKRPGNGVAPMELWSYLGRHSPRAYEIDDLIDPLPAKAS